MDSAIPLYWSVVSDHDRDNYIDYIVCELRRFLLSQNSTKTELFGVRTSCPIYTGVLGLLSHR